MLRGKVTNVTSAGVFVQTADYGTVGPCQAVAAPYTVGDAVLCVNVGTESAPDLVVVGTVSATGSAASIPDGSITSAKIADGTIVNADISGSAAIAKTKIAGTAITAADSGTVTSAMIADGTIVDGDINASAAIARSKISGLPTSSTDNTLPRFDSTAGALQTSGIVVDDNNRLRVASGSSGGLEIGSSGVLTLSYTGTPSGVSAPVGSTWRQTDANSTYGNLTGLLWNKVNTGTTLGTDWLVDFEGRWIDWTPTLTNITRGTGYSQRNRYTITSKTLSFEFGLHFGTGGAVSAEPSITLPVTPTAAFEKQFPALLRTTSTYSLGFGYQNNSSTLTFYALGSAGTLIGDIASVTGLAGSWATSGRLYVSGTYEIA